MFGGVGFSLHPPREGVGLYPSDHGLVLVRLDAPEAVDGAWQVTESRTAEHGCPAPSEARALASFVRAELVRAGWEQLPLALALPAAEAETGLRELPVRLAGAELRAALLWAMSGGSRGLVSGVFAAWSCLTARRRAIGWRVWRRSVYGGISLHSVR